MRATKRHGVIGPKNRVRYNKLVRIVLIAAKQLEFAKTRLAALMPDVERRVLAHAMFCDVLAAALSSRRADRVAVVTSDPTLLEESRKADAIVIDEEFPSGLNAAVKLATGALVAAGARQVCTVLSDIPMISAGDIDMVFDALTASPGVILVPSRDFTGTNMIARTPPDIIGTHFGRLSLVRHLDECQQAGIACEILRLARPALDLDLLSDLAEFVRVAGPSNTLNQLARLGIAPD